MKWKEFVSKVRGEVHQSWPSRRGIVWHLRQAVANVLAGGRWEVRESGTEPSTCKARRFYSFNRAAREATRILGGDFSQSNYEGGYFVPQGPLRRDIIHSVTIRDTTGHCTYLGRGFEKNNSNPVKSPDFQAEIWEPYQWGVLAQLFHVDTRGDGYGGTVREVAAA